MKALMIAPRGTNDGVPQRRFNRLISHGGTISKIRIELQCDPAREVGRASYLILLIMCSPCASTTDINSFADKVCFGTHS